MYQEDQNIIIEAYIENTSDTQNNLSGNEFIITFTPKNENEGLSCHLQKNIGKMAKEVDFGKLWSLGQYALRTKCTWSFSLPVRLVFRPLVVSVTLPDTRYENLCATGVAPSLGEFQEGREWDTWSFLWQTVQTEALPTVAALLAF